MGQQLFPLQKVQFMRDISTFRVHFTFVCGFCCKSATICHLAFRKKSWGEMESSPCIQNCFANPFKADFPFSTINLFPHNSAICFFNFSTAGFDLLRTSTSSTLSNQLAQSTTVSTFCSIALGMALGGMILLSGIKKGTFIFLFLVIRGFRLFRAFFGG